MAFQITCCQFVILQDSVIFVGLMWHKWYSASIDSTCMCASSKIMIILKLKNKINTFLFFHIKLIRKRQWQLKKKPRQRKGNFSWQKM